MKTIVFAAISAVILSGSAPAADRFRVRTKSVIATAPSGVTTAHEDAVAMARVGRLRHSGGARCREGIGFSTLSAQDALDRCCYSGKYPVTEQAVVRGESGWFAVRRYAR